MDSVGPAAGNDVRELFNVVATFRWRLGRERALLYTLRGLILGLILATLLAAADWLRGADGVASWTTLAAILLLAPAAGLSVALLGWPSAGQAARAADRHLRLDERLGTAVELAVRAHAGATGRFDRLQVIDAVEHTRRVPRTWPPFVRTHRHELALLAGSIGLASAIVWLPLLPHPEFARPDVPSPGAESDVGQAERVVPPDLAAARPGEAGAAQPAAARTPAVPSAAQGASPRQIEQAEAERQALDRLAQALSQLSAGQPAADAIQRGDYPAAREQIASLGEEADQLSDAAKQQLAQALQSAANSTPADRQLADRERQAAQALARSSYTDQRQSLRQLGEQVERSAGRSLPAAQLQRAQAQSAAQGQSGDSQRQDAAGGGQGSTSSSQASGDANAQGAGSPGVGTGTTDPFGDPSPRLDTAGQQVDVPLKLGQGPGERPPNGSEDGASVTSSNAPRGVAEQIQPQQPGQVVPERNLVPSEQRPVVRGYFR